MERRKAGGKLTEHELSSRQVSAAMLSVLLMFPRPRKGTTQPRRTPQRMAVSQTWCRGQDLPIVVSPQAEARKRETNLAGRLSRCAVEQKQSPCVQHGVPPVLMILPSLDRHRLHPTLAHSRALAVPRA